MKTQLQFISVVILVLFVGAQSVADLHLTVNNEPVDSTALVIGQTCMIEAVSDDGAPYTAYWLYIDNPSLAELTLVETLPEAGSSASATDGGGRAL